MKIADLKIHVLKSPLAEPFAFSQGWVRQRSATIIEVLTDQGLTGWGEAFAQGRSRRKSRPLPSTRRCGHWSPVPTRSTTKCCGIACITRRETTAARVR